MTSNRTATIMCWVGRVWSIASLALVGAFLIGERLPPLDLRHMFFPFGVLLGLILAWRLEKSGGFVATLSLLLFYVTHFAESGRFPEGPWFFLIAAPGFLLLCCGFLRAKTTKDTTAEPDGAANGSQPTRSETNSTSSAAGSRR